MRGHAGGMGSTNEGHAPMKKGSLLAPFALPLTAYFFVGCFKSDSSREALKKATREERGLPEGACCFSAEAPGEDQ
jgi:hypothetical protein